MGIHKNPKENTISTIKQKIIRRMEGRYTKFVLIATLALVVASANADPFSGFNFCNLNAGALKGACPNQGNNPSPQCCNAVKGVDPKCVCILINSPLISNNKEQVKQLLGKCGVNANMNC